MARTRQPARRPRSENYVPELVLCRYAQTQQYQKERSKYLATEGKGRKMAKTKKTSQRSLKSQSAVSGKKLVKKSDGIKKGNSLKGKIKKKGNQPVVKEKTARKKQRENEDDNSSTEEEVEEDDENEDEEVEEMDEEDEDTEEEDENRLEDGDVEEEKEGYSKDQDDDISATKDNENDDSRKPRDSGKESSAKGKVNDGSSDSGSSSGNEEDDNNDADSKKSKFLQRLQRKQKYPTLNVSEMGHLSSYVRHHLFRKCKFINDSLIDDFVKTFCAKERIDGPDVMSKKFKDMRKLIKDSFNSRRGYATQQIVEKMRGKKLLIAFIIIFFISNVVFSYF